MTENQIVLIYDPGSRPAHLHLTVHSFIDDWFCLCFIKQDLKSKAVLVAPSVNCFQLHHHAFRTSSKLVFGGFTILKASIYQIALNTTCACGNTISLCREFNFWVLFQIPGLIGEVKWSRKLLLRQFITNVQNYKCQHHGDRGYLR